MLEIHGGSKTAPHGGEPDVGEDFGGGHECCFLLEGKGEGVAFLPHPGSELGDLRGRSFGLGLRSLGLADRDLESALGHRPPTSTDRDIRAIIGVDPAEMALDLVRLQPHELGAEVDGLLDRLGLGEDLVVKLPTFAALAPRIARTGNQGDACIDRELGLSAPCEDVTALDGRAGPSGMRHGERGALDLSGHGIHLSVFGLGDCLTNAPSIA
jgi:hypothetical protein